MQATYDGGKGRIYGDIDGDRIRIEWPSSDRWEGKGIWTINQEGSEIVGTFLD